MADVAESSTPLAGTNRNFPTTSERAGWGGSVAQPAGVIGRHFVALRFPICGMAGGCGCWHVAKNFGRRAYSSSASWGRMLLSQQAVRRFSRALDSRDFTVPTGTPRIWCQATSGSDPLATRRTDPLGWRGRLVQVVPGRDPPAARLERALEAGGRDLGTHLDKPGTHAVGTSAPGSGAGLSRPERRFSRSR
jgi:hypothetical protein